MNNSKFIIPIIVLIGICACERQADLKNTAQYSKNGVSFTLPGNWKVAEDDERNGYRFLFIETSGFASFRMDIYKKKDSFPIEEYVRKDIDRRTKKIERMPIETSKGKISNFNKFICGKDRQGIKHEFPATLFGVETPHTVEYYQSESEDKVVYLSSCAANEDLGKVGKGFDLIIGTLDFK